MTFSREALAKPEKKPKQKDYSFVFFAKTIVRNVLRNFKMQEKLITIGLRIKILKVDKYLMVP